MRLLIVGTLSGQIGTASKIAQNRGAKVSHVNDIDAAMENLRTGKGADLLLVDVGQDIKRFIEALTAERISTPVVACGVEADSQAAVTAIKAGAKEYLPLPPDEELIAAVLEAIAEESHNLIYRAPVMAAVVDMAEKIAPSDASVLITGESGTGKEVMAHHIHKKSKRASKDFISVNCAAIPENLLESELFGHEKGAFTGAIARRVGKFEEADGGTLLLDEISEMDIRLQAKLLRAIQEQEIDRVGGTKPVKVNIRIIATSNRDLEKHVKSGNFREDLYFRLNVINLEIPPLRDRVEEIEPLAELFIQKYSKANGMPPRPLATSALEKMQHYRWPGNVRELENICHRAVLMASGNKISEEAILLPGGSANNTPKPEEAEPKPVADTNTKERAEESAPATTSTSSDGGGKVLVGRTVADVEKDLIINTVEHCLGNRTHAANILGISIRTLRNKLKQYGDSGTQVPEASSEEV